MAATEESIARDLAEVHHIGTTDPKIKTFEFDKHYQTKLAALSLRDTAFNDRADGLLKPEHFEDQNNAIFVNIAQEYFSKYRKSPDSLTVKEILKDKVKSKIVRKDLISGVKEKFKELYKHDISDREFAIERVADFAKRQATESAILKSATLLSAKGTKIDYDKIDKLLSDARDIGANSINSEYDYFGEIESRTQERVDILSGKIKPNGITTGIDKFDQKLLHRGWGRGELSVYMGGAKVGKSIGLAESARNALVCGYNVLYITLENSKKITADRLDAGFTRIAMNDLSKKSFDIKDRVIDIAKMCGIFKIHEFPSGSMKPSDLRRVINMHKAKGIIFDLVVIDYLDIMAPEYRHSTDIGDSKSIWVDCRGIAQEEGFAMLSATQTNRDGFKSSVAKAEHVAEDFNKIRIADLVISINSTEEEKITGEARLHFAASRNQETGITLFIKQNLPSMQFIESFVRVE